MQHKVLGIFSKNPLPPLVLTSVGCKVLWDCHKVEVQKLMNLFPWETVELLF